MLDMKDICDARLAGGTETADLHPYIAELLSDASQVMLDYLSEDLGDYERTGHASATIEHFLGRARCLADADRIAMKFAA